MSQIDDLLENLEFIRWVKYPDDELATFWKSWMEANPSRIADVKFAREIILGLQFPSKSAPDATKKEVLTRILRETEPQPEPDRLRPIHQTAAKTFWRISRVAAILVGVALLFTFLFKQRVGEVVVQPVSSPWIVKATNAGEKLNFRLPDQTIVWLNSGSSLEFPETFDSTVRLVKLKGEGFFEVAENANQPFQVLSENLITTALGTSFNINILQDQEIHVSLVTGKVAVSNRLDSLDFLLEPGQELNYSVSGKEGNVTKFSEESVLGWRFGKLVFTKSSLTEIKKTLEEWYGVKIQLVGKPGREWQFNGRFENQTLENVLESMSNIENFTYKIDNKDVTLSFNQ
ncbi:DUF4974 domain-containing protein [Algoriphagus jejuensis]|uniref:DUF4974 domain-containing protein n=1 Tax=Algoriphagus jejuensis TaxID=419934 RepID=A0ABP3YM86_9BACT